MGYAVLNSIPGSRLAQASGSLLAGIWVGELIGIVHPVAWLAVIVGAALAMFMVIAVARASAHIRLLFGIVITTAVVLAWWQGVPEALLRGFQRSQIFGAFLPSVLFLRATAESSPRIERLRHGLGNLDSVAAQNWTLYGSHVLGAVLNVGAMSVLAPVVTRDAERKERQRLAASSAQGVGTAVMWSPFFVAMGFTSQLVPRVPMWQVMAIGAGLAAIGLALSQAFFTPSLGMRAYLASVAQLRSLAAPMAVVITAVVGASETFGWSGLQSVAFVVPVCSVPYLMSLGASTARKATRQALQSFGRLADELLIVVGATILAVVVAAIPATHSMGTYLTPGFISGFALLAALVFVLVVLGLAGLHPMIGAGILLPVLAAGPFGICHPILVETAVFAWGLSASISMWTLPIVAASINFLVPVRDLFSRRSLLFGVAWGVVGILYLGIVNALCGAR